MIIDSHQHIFSSAEKQLALMDEAGIEKAILFSSMVHPENALTFDEFNGEMSKLYSILADGNAAASARVMAAVELSDRVKRYPERFAGFGGCPAGMDFENTASWIEKNIIAHGFRGIGEITYPPGKTSLIENIFIFSHENGLHLPLWIHTFNPLNGGDVRDIVSLAQKYADVPVIMGHSGGYHWIDLLKEAENSANIYIDLSAQFTVFSLKYFAEKMPERIIFSSDAPYGDPLLGVQAIERLITNKSIRENALYGNIRKLIG